MNFIESPSNAVTFLFFFSILSTLFLETHAKLKITLFCFRHYHHYFSLLWYTWKIAPNFDRVNLWFVYFRWQKEHEFYVPQLLMTKTQKKNLKQTILRRKYNRMSAKISETAGLIAHRPYTKIKIMSYKVKKCLFFLIKMSFSAELLRMRVRWVYLLVLWWF